MHFKTYLLFGMVLQFCHFEILLKLCDFCSLSQQYENQQSDFSVTERPGEELLNDINAAFTEFLLNKTQALDVST